MRMVPKVHMWRELFSDSAFAKFLTFDLLLSALVGVLTWQWTDASFNGFLAFLFSVIVVASMGHHAELVMTRRRVAGALKVHVRLLEADDVLYTEGYNVGRAYSALLVQDDAFFLEHARRLLRDCAMHLTWMADGQLRISDTRVVYDVLQERLYAAEKSLFFTSLVRSDPFWGSADGNAYLEANLERARTKTVRIDRIFIFEGDDEIGEGLADVIYGQLDAGIHVRIAYAKRLTADLHRDMGIYDDRYVGYLDLSPTREIQELVFRNAKDDLDKARKLKKRLERNSVDARNVLPKRAQQSHAGALAPTSPRSA